MELASILLTGGGMLLNVFVIPTLLNKKTAIPRTQSFPTALALVGMTIGYVLLGVTLPALATALGVVLWTLVGIYRHPK